MNGLVQTAEEAFVAALMALDYRQAAQAVDLLQHEDIASPAVQLVHQLVHRLCAAAVNPDPAAVLALAISEEHATGQHQIHAFANVLMRLMDHRAGNSPGSVRWYAAQTLEQAWRRRTVEMTTRVAQVAGHADPAELDRLTHADRAELDRLTHADRAELDRLTHAEQAAVDAMRARHRALTEPTRGLAAVA